MADIKIWHLRIRRATEIGCSFSLMKTFKRTSLGIISTLLLAAGLARAAQQVDPLTKSIGLNSHAAANEKPSCDCSSPCILIGD
jgi:hypothetical protein